MPVETERPKFLIDLLAEIDAFDETLFPPNAAFKADEGDVRVGELPPWCRKAYALCRSLNRQGKLLVAGRDYDNIKEIGSDAEICELRYKANLLNELMYAVLRSESKAFNTESVGVREGWQFVSSKPEDDDPFSKILDGLRRGRI